jgi:hypothetical protein
MAGLLSKERIVAGPRWPLVERRCGPGHQLEHRQAYAFSVFNLPLTRVLGISDLFRRLEAGLARLDLHPRLFSRPLRRWAASGRTAWDRA